MSIIVQMWGKNEMKGLQKLSDFKNVQDVRKIEQEK